ncbi:MAG: tRNA (adenosine(37)-N6)-threonylcarbamoyltransferase complex dimerization subunit type 1 TsaB [Rhodospirillaceae bacterium]|nr:tRNA (adenosine(37)-N6)-threonylcarbamoyltransferase complex dimerization subunit type 1 TsaB [Rhodospirillaceae bacterium]
MLILAFDTSAGACSAVLWRDEAVLSSGRVLMDQGQAEALMPLIEEVMARGGATYADLDRIAVSVGPGSFTGVRVGLSAARGLGLAAGKPIVGVTTTEILAASVSDAERQSAGEFAHVLAAIDTKRGDLYVQQFDRALREAGPVRAMAPNGLAEWTEPGPLLVAGDAAAIAIASIGPRALLSSADALPEPAILARLAARRDPRPDGPVPVYVRPPEAVIPRHGGRLRP